MPHVYNSGNKLGGVPPGIKEWLNLPIPALKAIVANGP